LAGPTLLGAARWLALAEGGGAMSCGLGVLGAVGRAEALGLAAEAIAASSGEEGGETEETGADADTDGGDSTWVPTGALAARASSQSFAPTPPKSSRAIHGTIERRFGM
jgi:hypothetical protein